MHRPGNRIQQTLIRHLRPSRDRRLPGEGLLLMIQRVRGVQEVQGRLRVHGVADVEADADVAPRLDRWSFRSR